MDRLRAELRSKEVEMADVKRALGITPFVEFKQSITHGWEVIGSKFKGIQESEKLVGTTSLSGHLYEQDTFVCPKCHICILNNL